jgi:hypothetical protein
MRDPQFMHFLLIPLFLKIVIVFMHKRGRIKMKTKTLPKILAANILALGLLGVPAAHAEPVGVKVGMLNCNVASGWGFIFESTRDVNCTYAPKSGVAFHYAGHISKFGVDIGYVQGGVMIWEIFAPGTDIGPDALSGEYAGVTGGASVGVGVDANVLVGGSNKAISLQPVSLEGNEGLNVAAGIAALHLKYQPPVQSVSQPGGYQPMPPATPQSP